MPFTVKLNVALRERICQKIGSERVKIDIDCDILNYVKISCILCGAEQGRNVRQNVQC